MRERALDFSTRFFDMVGDIKRALWESKDDPISIVGTLHISGGEFAPMPLAILKSLEEAANMKRLLFKLDGYWDPFNYYPLAKIIMTRPSDGYDDLKKRMKCYVREMDQFRRHTYIEVYCKAFLSQTSRNKVPKGFKEKKWKKEDLRTLHDVEMFRREIACKHKLEECLVFCKHIGLGSVIITLWIPLCEENGNEVVEVEDGDVDENQDSSVALRPYSLISSVSSVVTKYVFDPFVSS